jgi:uncharacterized protein
MRRLAFVFLLVVSAAAYAADAAFPPLTGRVVDQAGILSPSAEQSLTTDLQAHEQSTSQQVVVATVASLGERDIAAYGVELGRAWGIGQKDKNTGVILLVAPNEREVRIEIGYGLEGTLTDATSRLIIENIILPDFRAGNMEAGIVAGVGAILSVLRGDPDVAPQPPPVRQKDPGEIPIIVIMIVFFLLTRLRRKRRGILPILLGQPTVWHGGSRRAGGFGGFGGGGRRGGGGSFGGGGASGKW